MNFSSLHSLSVLNYASKVEDSKIISISPETRALFISHCSATIYMVGQIYSTLFRYLNKQ